MINSNALTVSQLNKQIRAWLENDIGEVIVTGEVSNLSKPSSGHLYFSMKDTSAQLRCVYFRNRHKHALENGQHIIVRGTLSVYEARGDYQLIVDQIEDVGQGLLYQQFTALKNKLAAQGLFDVARKKALPKYPMCIGIITSKQAAALQDILITIQRRFPIAQIILYPSDVQGKQASPQLINAIELATQDQRCDVLLLTRGGGSLEDLWAFNDEQLAMKIANCNIPIVTGIGHETDFTIADFVADYRAATPTAAAETITPDGVKLIEFFASSQQKLLRAITRLIQHQTVVLTYISNQLSSPQQVMRAHWQTIDYLESRLHNSFKQRLEHHGRQYITHLITNLFNSINTLLTSHQQQLLTKLATLHAVSPLATLQRGYAIVTHHKHVIRDSREVSPGNILKLQLANGSLLCECLQEK